MADLFRGNPYSYRATLFAGTYLGGSAGIVLPIADTSWRIQPTAVTFTGTNNDTTSASVLMASKANNDLPTFVQSAAGATVALMDLPAIPAPGAIMFLTTSSGSPTQRALALAYSTDGGTSYTSVPVSQFQTVSGTNNLDQVLDMPATAAAKWRLTYTSTGSAHAFRFQINQLQSDPLRNPIFVISGMSKTIAATPSGVVRDDFVTRNPAIDPVIVSVARAGARPADMLTEQLQGIVQTRSYFLRIIQDFGPNDFLNGAGGAWANASTSVQAAVLAGVQSNFDWASANNRTLFEVSPGFQDPSDTSAGFPAQYNNTTFTVNQSAVVENGASVSVANEDNGIRGFNTNAYNPKSRIGSPSSFDPATNLPYGDGAAITRALWENDLTATGTGRQGASGNDGVHETAYGQQIYRLAILDALYRLFGLARDHFLKRRIDAFTRTGGISTVQRNRYYATLNSLDPNMVSSVRTSWQGLIDAIPSAYQQPAGQADPATLSGMVFSFDFDDPSTMFRNDAGTLNGLEYDLMRVVKSKVGSGTLTNATSYAAPFYRQPFYRADQINGRGALAFPVIANAFQSGTGAFLTLDATSAGAFNAASQPFTFSWSETVGLGTPSGGVQWALRNGTTTVLQMSYPADNDGKLRVGGSGLGLNETSSPIKGTAHAYTLVYDGTNITLYRDGVVTIGPTAWTKPAWTADNLLLSFIGRSTIDVTDFHGATTAASATSDALKARTRAKVGT